MAESKPRRSSRRLRGVDGLMRHGLLDARDRKVTDPRARFGVTTIIEHQLLGDFATGDYVPADVVEES